MKKALFVAALTAASLSAYAQGTVNFSNKVAAVGLDAPVLDNNGSKVAAAAFLVQLYSGADAGSLAPVGTAAAFKVDGYFSAGSLEIPGTSPAGSALVEVRAWEAAKGATFEAAAAAGGKFGKSNQFTVTGLGGGSPPATPANLTGMQSFSMVPEPSTVALGILGAAALLAFRRK